MKKTIIISSLLLIAALICGIDSHAQEVQYDSVGAYQYMPISPVTIVDQRATRLFARANDDLVSSVLFYYELRDESGKALIIGNVTMSGKDYENWNANDPASAYIFIANAKHLTFP